MKSGERVLFLELLDEASEGVLLLGRSGVLGLTSFGESSYVADAEWDSVVTCAVGACFWLGATNMDASITIDDKVIAYAFPAFGFMPAVDVGNGVVLTFDGGGTMDDDFCIFLISDSQFHQEPQKFWLLWKKELG